jgi:putative ABC transport system permease protein
MNLFQLVIKQMRQRALSTWLTLLSVTLGVGLAITILILYREAGSLFGQTDYGCDVLIGKQGSGTQLVMNTIYHIDKSPGNIPYSVYEECLDPQRLPKIAVPIVLGEMYDGGFRVVGTTTNILGIDDETQKPLPAAETICYSPKQHFELSDGKCFAPNRFEAVIGSDVAGKGMKVGSEMTLPGGTEKWTVVGILKQTFTAMDDSVLVPLRGYYALPEHAKNLRQQWEDQFPPRQPSADAASAPATQPAEKPSYKLNPDGSFAVALPENMWRISAILAQSRGSVQRLIEENNRKAVQVVDPTDVMKKAGSVLGPPDFGFNAVFGAPGPADQLVKSCVYHIGKPPGTILYSVYSDMTDALKLLPAEEKTMNSMAVSQTTPTSQPADAGGEAKEAPMNFYQYARVTVPTAVGDTYKGKYRIIATTTNLFGIDDFTGNKLDADHTMGYRPDKFYEFADGRCFEPDKFEAILGSETAAKSGLHIGSTFQATHGETPPTANPDIHPEKWVVVGVLKKTFTANDSCVFIPLKTDYTVEDHDIGEKVQWALKHGGEAPPANTDPDEVHSYRVRKDGTFELFVPHEIWEISALQVKARGDPQQLMYAINNRNEAMAVNPANVMRTFFDTFLKGPTLLLLVVAFLVSIVAAVGILVSIYNSVSARLREIAIMRALGATRNRVLELICIEAGLVGLFGGILGLIGGHLLAAIASVLFNQFIGEGINWMRIDVNEVYYLCAVVVVAVLAGLVPAMKAYRTPVATNLVVV